MLSAVWMSAQGESAKISTGIRAVAGRGRGVQSVARSSHAMHASRGYCLHVRRKPGSASFGGWFPCGLRSLRSDNGVNEPAEVIRCEVPSSKGVAVRQRHPVRYRSGEGLWAPDEAAASLRPEELAALPEEFRAELTKAVIAQDVERITLITLMIRQVSEHNAALSGLLAHFAERLGSWIVFLGELLQVHRTDGCSRPTDLPLAEN